MAWLPRDSSADENVALSSVTRSNPVKAASWSRLKLPLPTNARTSVPAPPVRLSPAFSVAAVAYTVEPDDGATNVSLPGVSPTTPGEGAGAAYVPVWSVIVSMELVAKISVRWAAVRVRPCAISVSCPEPPAI